MRLSAINLRSGRLNQVARAIRRGSFSSVKDLVTKIQQLAQVYNRDSKPFMWYATADSISRG